MADQWICPHCAQTNPVEMRFCPACGTVNPAAADNPSPASALPPAQQRLWWGVAIALWVIGCSVLAIGGGIWWGRQNNGQTDLSANVEEPAAVETVIAEPTASPVPEVSVATETTEPEPTPLPTETVPVVQPTDVGDRFGQGADQTTPVSDADIAAGDTLTLPTSSPAPAPEGVILFLSSRDHDPQSETEKKRLAQHRELELYAMRPDGSGQIRLSYESPQWASEVAWITPYFQPGQIVVNGSSVFDLSALQIVDQIALKFDIPPSTAPTSPLYPVWSSAGEIIFGLDHCIQYVANIDSQRQELTSVPDNLYGDNWPALSPDGKQIAFMRFWDDPAQNGLWLMTITGNEAHRIFDGDTRRPFWSPDGRRLAFEGSKPNRKKSSFTFELWVVEADGTNPRQITTLPEEVGGWEPKWSPDSTRLVFQVEELPGWLSQLYVVDVNSGKLQQLTENGDQNIAPLWLPLAYDDLVQAVASLSSPPTPTPVPTPRPATPQPAPPAIPNCPVPGVKITSPAPGTRFTQRHNFIMGTANIPQFHHWKMEYSTSPGGGWQFLLERDYPVDNDKLIMFDAKTVPRGPYGLRLTVVETTGNYPEPCEVWFVNGY